MKLDDPFLGKAQVHAFCVLQVEGTLVELGDRVVGVQQRRLFVHFTNDLERAKEEEICQLEDRWENVRETREILKRENRDFGRSQRGMKE